jgi:hypothetical protein
MDYMNKSEIIYYAGYGSAGMLLGIFAMLSVLRLLTLLQAFTLWLFSVGFVLTVLGCVRISPSSKRLSALTGFGSGLVIMFGCLSAFAFKLISFYVAILIIITVVSAEVIGYGLTKARRGK